MSIESSAWWHFADEEPVASNTTFHSVVRRANRTQLPTTDEERNAPLNVTEFVKPLDFTAVLQRMADSRRRRVEEVFGLLRRFVPKRDGGYPPLPLADGQRLIDNGIAEPALDCSPIGLAHAFSVIEHKAKGIRRRFILHPAEANEWLAEEGYTADVPLPHVTALLGAAHLDFAICEDFKSGFHQIKLPLSMRHHFRFRCGDRVLQMTRLPMGLRTSPEIFHSVAATLAGDRVYCTPAHAVKGVRVDTWIDNVRFAGKRASVAAAHDAFIANCKAVGATLNDDDRQTGINHVFCGVQFGPGTVAVAAKTHARVASIVPKINDGSITNGELEALFGRLWFASAVLGIKTFAFWWAIKSARRRLSDVNRGARALDAPAELASSAINDLKSWTALVVANAPSAPLKPDSGSLCASFTMFSDASLTGWGAVLIDESTQQTRIAGGRWAYEVNNINAAEARAVALGLEAFKEVITPGVALHLRIDNTSALAAVRKQRANSGAVNAELQRVFDRLIGVELTTEYVKSADNLADGASRGLANLE